MIRYVIKRLLLMIPIILGVVFIIFFILNVIPGDPASLILGNFVPLEAKIRLNEELGIYRPLLVRYVDYVYNAVQGNFGNSWRTGTPAFTEIFARFPTTIRLALFSIILAVAIGVPLGILAAVKQHTWMDSVASVSAMFLSSIPSFWMGLLAVLLFSLRMGLLPSNGADSWRHFVLPVVTLALPAAADFLRLTRSTMLEVIRQDYVRTARAKGASKRLVVWRHALGNALLPIVTVAAMYFGGLLGGVVITEQVFAMPGIGTLTINAIRSQDTPQVMAAVVLLATIFCVIMLIVDLLYAFIDPRVRARYSKG